MMKEDVDKKQYNVELAILKEKFDNLSNDVKEHMHREEADRALFLDILTKQGKALEALEDSLNRYKSFIGGIMWTISALFAAAATIYQLFFTSSPPS